MKNLQTNLRTFSGKVVVVLSLMSTQSALATISENQALQKALRYSEQLPIDEGTGEEHTDVNKDLDPMLWPDFPEINAYSFFLTKDGEVRPSEFLVRRCSLQVFVDPDTGKTVPKAYWKNGGLYDEVSTSWSCYWSDFGPSDFGGGV